MSGQGENTHTDTHRHALADRMCICLLLSVWQRGSVSGRFMGVLVGYLCSSTSFFSNLHLVLSFGGVVCWCDVNQMCYTERMRCELAAQLTNIIIMYYKDYLKLFSSVHLFIEYFHSQLWWTLTKSIHRCIFDVWALFFWFFFSFS